MSPIPNCFYGHGLAEPVDESSTIKGDNWMVEIGGGPSTKYVNIGDTPSAYDPAWLEDEDQFRAFLKAVRTLGAKLGWAEEDA